MRVIYVSEDGKTFEDENECKNYELQKKLNSMECPLMWDRHGNPTEYVEKAYYIKVEDQEQAKAFLLKSQASGYTYPLDLRQKSENDGFI